MPAVRNEPLEMLAPTLLMSCTTSAIASTSLTEYGVSTWMVILPALLKHQMGFDVIHLGEDLEHAHAIDCAGGAGNTDNEPLLVIQLRNSTVS